MPTRANASLGNRNMREASPAAGRAVYHADTPPVAFVEGMRDLCRRLRAHVPDLDAKDTQFLKDVERAEGRYSFRGVQRIAEIAARSAAAEDRETFPELIRATSRRRAWVSVDDAIIDETRAQSELDLAQLEWKGAKTPANLARLVECAERQMGVTRTLIDTCRARVS